MIPIKKGNAPQILTTKGTPLIESMKLAFDSGQKEFEFDSAIYGGKTVKDALSKAQHNKCCFCESSLHAQHGDVEHFRPKGGWKQTDTDKLSSVGYYWLAYDWDNLFLSCQKCNQTFKKNFFPLENPNSRAIDHTHDIQQEISLILNPAKDNPQEHLLFKREIITHKTLRGKETIKRTAIDQELFEEDRREKLLTIEALLNSLLLVEKEKIETPSAQSIIATIKDFVSPQKPYYAMLRDNFKGNLKAIGIIIP
jgi:uncharacterized protein (TIGR02646 family)